MSAKFKIICWACTGTLMYTMTVSAAFAQELTRTLNDDGAPFCSDASFDIDGDGWGWENNRSCIVNSSSSQNTHPTCSNANSDPDGDGYGWENSRTCVVSSTNSQNTHPVCSNANSDPDGDGYGWENSRTCVVNSSNTATNTIGNSQNTLPTCSNANSDPDGDGYGWENSRSCLVAETVTDIEPVTDIAETGTDESVTDIEPVTDIAEAGTDESVTDIEPVADIAESTTDESITDIAPTTDIAEIVNSSEDSTITTSNSQTFPTCSNANSDPDGDGYGWENNRSCLVAETVTDESVADIETTTDHPVCSDSNSDPDGDGYGWELGRSCVVAQNTTPNTNNKAPVADPVACTGPNPDSDGDGFGFENGQVCFVDAKKAPADVQVVVTPDGTNPFSKFQLDGTLYTNNVYDLRQRDQANNGQLIFYNGVQDFVRWNVPASIGNNPNPCVRTQTADPVTLSYRLTSRKDSPTERNSFVRSYPAMVVGTMGGRFESWGVECGAIQTLQTNAQRHGNSPVFQMETVAAATGMPVFAGELDFDVRASVKADLLAGSANNGVANVFLDSYWHDVSDQSIVPSGDLVNTINGINSNFTEVWNLNIWFDYPRSEGNASSWTGGFKIGSVSLNEGGDFDVYFKIEGARNGHLPRCVIGRSDNCFLYIALVAVDPNASRNGVTVNYTEIAEWMRSSVFRDLFLVGASESDTNAAKAYEAWRLIDGTDNDNSPDPARRGPRFPDRNHVLGGMHLGAELWYNPDAVPASIVFETLGVEVEGKGQFGRYVRH